MDDVRNLTARLKPKALSEKDAIAEMVLDFDLQSPKNVSTVNEN
ncbi:hypothetical protein PPTG_24986, partial [Phytophthora nicotianae INRA-310]